MDKLKLPTYGGQAVIEGVMMRGKESLAIAMRAPDDSIVIHEDQLGSIYRSKIVQIPFLRGMVLLWDALGLGMQALTISANTQSGEDEQIEGPTLIITLIISLVFAVSLFFLLPAGAGHLFERLITSAFSLDASQANTAAWIGNVLEGLLRLAILIGYIWFIGRIPDIKRVFAYHGAEHKTINAFESGA